jgi:hypothetical protein
MIAPKHLFFIIIASIWLMAGCKTTRAESNTEPQNITTMDSIPNNDYAKAWAEIDSLDERGLPKSALEKVDLLFEVALADKNAPQEVKCLIYKFKYEENISEESYIDNLEKLEKRIDSLDFPAQPLLQSYLASFYQLYLDGNMWKFKDRTPIGGGEVDDAETWSYEALVNKITSLYFASLEHDGLTNIPLSSVKALIVNFNENDKRRTTVFDLLAFEAIDFFKNERYALNKPVYEFQIEDKEAFADAKIFVNYDFQSKDTASFKWKTLLLFQKTLKEQIQKEDKSALLDTDLNRLSFVKNNSTLAEKDELYKNALLRLLKQYEGTPIRSQVLFELAELEVAEGSQYEVKPYWQDDSPENLALKNKNITAANLCKEAMETYKGSIGARQCESLLSRIKSKSLGLETESIYPFGNNILARIFYQNIDISYVKIVKVTVKDLKEMRGIHWNGRLDFINNLPIESSWSIPLPGTEDFRRHSLEFNIPKQKLGRYFVVASDNSDFSEDGGAVSFTLIQVSDLALIELDEQKSLRSSFLVVNRESGTPEEDVKVTFYTQEYDRNFRNYVLKELSKTESDEDGFFSLNHNRGINFKIRLEKGKDIQEPQQNFYNNFRSEKQETSRVHFFLDRKIYRPGQTVHFKAIIVNYDKDKIPSIATNKKLIFTLFDSNNQEVESLELLTNEYGTCSGSFETPTAGLLGRMSIRATSGDNNFYGNSITFRVEEYKRPKFEVNLEKSDDEISLGDTVKIKGNAMAFAGYPIDGANFTYKVVRGINYPYWPWWRWGKPNFSRSQTIIKNGTGKTGKNGEIDLSFHALPDPTIAKETKPEFTYTISVDVTDQNGETKSTQSEIKLAYTSVYLDILSKDEVELENWDSLLLASNNIEGNPLETNINVKIEKLKAPQWPIIERYWTYPDMTILGENEFKNLFPDYSYNGQEKVENWPIDELVWKKSLSIKGKSQIPIPGSTWSQGNYLVTLSGKDKSGLAVEKKKFITVNDRKNPQPVIPDFLWFNQPDKSFEPGSEVKLIFKSSINRVLVLLEETRLKQDGEPYWKNIKTNQSITIPVTENDRGNVLFQATYVQKNRFYQRNYTIQVPWNNKELSFDFQSFRDKLDPGSEETWDIKISGNQKDKVAAEMLVSMYDASLDAFAGNFWSFDAFPQIGYSRNNRSIGFGTERGQLLSKNWQVFKAYTPDKYPYLNFKGINPYGLSDIIVTGYKIPLIDQDNTTQGRTLTADDVKNLPSRNISKMAEMSFEEMADEEIEENQQPNTEPPIRTNLKETVFFYPDLKTDEEGNVIFSFTMNEALTRWKFMGLAHTKELVSGIITKEVVTQKDLMVVPNPPRFFREGDEIYFSAKVVNLSDKDLDGTVSLQLLDAISGNPVNTKLGNYNPEQSFQIKAGSSESFKWPLKVPLDGVQAITHRVIAKAGSFSDGEESALPVLTNRMLVTESLPLPVRGESSGTFVLKNLRDNTSNTLTHERMTLEFTQNPAWYAVKSLPYLMEYPYECTEQIFSRYYANSLASHVANAHPKVKRVFDAWKNFQPEALESQLTKNQELKSALLEETPWVLQAQSEAAQRKNIGLLFDLNRMGNEQQNALRKLAERQEGNGGWSWFPGGRPSWYITQYLVEGMGRLNKMGVQQDQQSEEMLRKAVAFIDFSLHTHYNDLVERLRDDKERLAEDHLDNIVIHYLYARSFFLEKGQWLATSNKDGNYSFNREHSAAIEYYLGQAERYALDKEIYQQGLLALSLLRWESETEIPTQIVQSLEERSLNNPELGMYWKYPRGWWWYQAPIETHSLMIEVFDEVARDPQSVDDLKVWLLKNKQTTHWKTTKATANAVYALLMNGDNWLLEDKPISFEWAGKKFKSSDFDQEAGSGYFKTSWSGDYLEMKEKEVGKNAIATMEVENPNKNVAWGAMYWQYFEQLDKITTFEETPLTLKKDIFKVVNTDTGEKLQPLEKSEGVYSKIEVGDKLKIRIELRVDRDMEYVHLKDMRAAGLEPIQVLSQYKWQDGLGYYESPGDVATNFFFSYLPKGTYVFEYPLRVQHAGDFSNGISNIQCMYAPEFTSHSAGLRLKVDK